MRLLWGEGDRKFSRPWTAPLLSAWDKYNGVPDWGIWVELSEEVVASFHCYKTGWVIDLSIYGKGRSDTVGAASP